MFFVMTTAECRSEHVNEHLSKGILTLIARVASDSTSSSDSELDASSSSDSDEGREYVAPQRKRPMDDVEDEESGVTGAAIYLQTKNEMVDANIMVPTISEVEPCDTLEKVGEISSIVGDVVIVRGLPMDHVNLSSERALDTESLLVFEDRKVLGYVSHFAFRTSLCRLSPVVPDTRDVRSNVPTTLSGQIQPTLSAGDRQNLVVPRSIPCSTTKSLCVRRPTQKATWQRCQ